MRIGFIGAGHVGGTLGKLFADAGHEVGLSNSRGPATLTELVERIGDRARAMTVPEAAEFGEVVIVSIPLRSYREVPAEPLSGKVVVDTNNYYAGRDGRIAELEDGSTTSSELLQAHLAGARVVKAFNTLYFEVLASQGRPAGASERFAIPISGDDDGAKKVVAGLIDEIGFDAVDVGDLSSGGRRQQPGSPIYNVLLSADQVREQLAGSA
jgi:8-hydroxy-5-deazaflavin:NADPH oxidoreductase